MRRLLLLSMFLFSISLFAQSTIDFETVGPDTGWTVFANGAGSDTDFVRVPNPDKSGINTSDYCMRFIVNADGEVYAGAYNGKLISFTLDNTNCIVKCMVYKNVISDFDLKLEPPNADHKVPNTVTGQWEELTFDYSSDIGVMPTTLTLIPDFPATRTSGSIAYIDNISFNPATPVPVELASFTASTIGNDVHLSWNTATEKNNSGFEIERSRDNKSFSKIGFVQGHGTTSDSKVYSFVDKSVNSRMYYRLKQVDYNGAYSYSKTVEAAALLPIEYSLNQNYPNPFNPSTKITYSLPQDNFVSLKVYNILGNEVATLVNEQISAGSHEINFNASNLSSGVYYYTLRTGNFVNTKKFMLLK